MNRRERKRQACAIAWHLIDGYVDRGGCLHPDLTESDQVGVESALKEVQNEMARRSANLDGGAYWADALRSSEEIVR